MAERIIVTGSGSKIGARVSNYFENLAYDVVRLDLPEYDLTDQSQLHNVLAKTGQVALLCHFAADMGEDWNGGSRPGNRVMNDNILRTSARHNVKWLVMASSVHTDTFLPASVLVLLKIRI